MSGRERDVDVLVVGGGPSGLATAVELRRLGAGSVAVIDREEALGGVPRHTSHTGYGLRDLHRVLTGPGYARHYIEWAARSGVELLPGTTATGWAGDTCLESSSADGLVRWRARSVVLATGCRERPRPARLVPGDRPAGVLTTGSLQQLTDLYGLPAGRRAVVVGAEHVSFSAVHTLTRHGTSVAAVVTDLAADQTYAPLRVATAGLHRVPVLTRASIEAVVGRPRVRAVRLRHADGRAATIDCDTVVFTGDWIPDHELARHGGVLVDPGTRGPAIDQSLRTSRPGVFAVGNLVHAAETADVAALSGRHAAAAVAHFLAGETWPEHASTAVRVAPPLRWVFPSRVTDGAGLPPRGRFLLRVSVLLGPGRLEVRQGGRLLHGERRRRLVPNRSISLPAGWLGAVDRAAGDVTVSWRAP